jgi:nicotinamidase-related amidase
MSLLSRDRAVVVAIDLQEKLLPAIDGGDTVVGNTVLVLRLAATLGLPVVVTTQYRKGLGDVVPEVRAAVAGRGLAFDGRQRVPALLVK